MTDLSKEHKQKRKPKIFIAGVINNNWSQDLNARTMALNVDKNKFKVISMVSYRNVFPIVLTNKLRILTRFYPDRISSFFCYLYGLWWADLVMVYRSSEHLSFLWLFRFFKAKTMRVLGTLPQGELNDRAKFKNIIFEYDYLFSLSKKNQEVCRSVGLNVRDEILFNPIDLSKFKPFWRARKSIKKIVFMGYSPYLKNVGEFFWLSQRFPHLEFHIIGGRTGHFERLIVDRDSLEVQNVFIHGLLDRDKLLDVLRTMDLHVLTSRVEGRPKSVFECGALGIPSIVYSDYGADEYIENGKNGYVVQDKEDILTVIQSFLDCSELELSTYSKNISNTVLRYDIKESIEKYNEVLLKICEDIKA